ncbi:MAG: hypothetical protein EAZ57_04630 [Cytophagales bacterium]|nr:MAG: hypothetical protein EAZ67_01250 [Cytophagales bacterium]TAF61079.1 MAG: hypothetical protein EAZ57_04630 [Cytophagales bacterium]
MSNILSFGFSLICLLLMAYLGYVFVTDAVLIGTWQDWVVGTAAFIWLMVIVTVPWNTHFKAKEVLDDAAISKRKDILVVEETLEYAKKVARNSLRVAILLHVVTALILLAIAFTGWSVVGYYAAALTALFAGLRPSIRYYEYVRHKLDGIKLEFRYPREDLYEVQRLLEDFKQRIETLENTLTLDPEKHSWRQDVDKMHHDLQYEIEELAQNTQKRTEELDLQHKEGMKKIAQDSAVLDSIRELVKFFKKS